MLGPRVPSGFTPQGFRFRPKVPAGPVFRVFVFGLKVSCGVYSSGLSSSASACRVYSLGIFVFRRSFVLGLLLAVFIFGQRGGRGLPTAVQQARTQEQIISKRKRSYI